MNQNRNQNRRRGRGSNRGGQGGHQSNRIDSRARGNAPQMLEKYKKLAHDASLNGDRVLTEYYLQFADHYFRVVADSRPQKDEARPRRDQDREQSFDSDDEENEDREDSGRDDKPRGEPPRRRRDRDDDERSDVPEGQPGIEGEEAREASPEDNPFVRESRGQRPRSRGRARPASGSSEKTDESAFDPGVLPPSIPRDETEAETKRPARSRARRARPAEDGDDEALKAVS